MADYYAEALIALPWYPDVSGSAPWPSKELPPLALSDSLRIAIDTFLDAGQKLKDIEAWLTNVANVPSQTSKKALADDAWAKCETKLQTSYRAATGTRDTIVTPSPAVGTYVPIGGSRHESNTFVQLNADVWALDITFTDSKGTYSVKVWASLVLSIVYK